MQLYPCAWGIVISKINYYKIKDSWLARVKNGELLFDNNMLSSLAFTGWRWLEKINLRQQAEVNANQKHYGTNCSLFPQL